MSAWLVYLRAFSGQYGDCETSNIAPCWGKGKGKGGDLIFFLLNFNWTRICLW